MNFKFILYIYLLFAHTIIFAQLKHINSIECTACQELLSICSPILIEWFNKEHTLDPALHIMQSYRNEKQQNAVFKNGSSLVEWGKSAHNYIPCLAIDLFFIIDGKSKTPPRKYKPLIDRLPETIENGSKIPRLVDWGHFQVKDWKSMAYNYPHGNRPSNSN